MDKALEEKIGFESDLDRQIANHEKDIPGWGIDADPQNNPTDPIKHWNGADHERLNYEKPPQQAPTVEVLHSIERPGLSCVFGTSVPPRGLSGSIRRFAFKYSENTYMHWLPLVIADRVDVIEGIIDDIKEVHFPNSIKEKGRSTEWKYNKKGLLKTVAIGAAVAVGLVILIKNNKDDGHDIEKLSGKLKKKNRQLKYSLQDS